MPGHLPLAPNGDSALLGLGPLIEALKVQIRAEMAVELEGMVARAVAASMSDAFLAAMGNVAGAIRDVQVHVAAPTVNNDVPESPVTVEVRPAAVTVERPRRQRVLYDDDDRIIGLESE
jgi:hypothetical protein